MAISIDLGQLELADSRKEHSFLGDSQHVVTSTATVVVPGVEPVVRALLVWLGLPGQVTATQTYTEPPGEMQAINDGIAALSAAFAPLAQAWSGRTITVDGMPETVAGS